MRYIRFNYSFVYDMTLSDLSGAELTREEAEEGFTFKERMEGVWEKESKVLDYYASLGFELPTDVSAYLTHSRNSFVPFSDPLTLHIQNDIDDVVATLVHEYCHRICMHPGNQDIWEDLWKRMEKYFPEESQVTKIHIVINKLTDAGLALHWGREKTDSVLRKEREYVGLARAWEILDNAALTSENPLEALKEWVS